MANKCCILRNTFFNRSSFLKLSLEYQKKAINNNKFKTYIYVDPHPIHGIVPEYNEVISSDYERIDFKYNAEKFSWYKATKDMFDRSDYDYIITIEDDVIISKDYLSLCEEIISIDILKKNNNILGFQIGPWEKPKGDVNLIVQGQHASLRSVLIYRETFFKYVDAFYEANSNSSDLKGLDQDLQTVLTQNKLITIGPYSNRHGHFGVSGWSASQGNDEIANLTHHEFYELLKLNCLSGSALQRLNNYYVPHYFWDFNPDVQYSQLVYAI